VNAVPSWLGALAGLEEWRLSRMLRNAPAPIRRRLFEEWSWQAHSGQREPPSTGSGSDWRTWLIMAGRGFGKTRAGAEWVLARVRETEGARVALVGGTIEEVVKVMIEGESGLKAAARTGEKVRWRPSRSILELPNDAIGLPYSGARPAKLRGPQHHFAWCDEIAKWRLPDESWDNLMLGLRLGMKPRAVVTTTPQPIPLLKRIQRLKGTVTSGGRTIDNVHLPADFVDAVTEAYGGTRLGRQELDGVYLEEREGALWTRALIEKCRVRPLSPGPSPAEGGGEMVRIVIGVDPPAGENGTCGIVVAGLASDGMAYVLADASAERARPERWAAAVARAADAWRADRVIAEANQGGAMVETVLRAVEQALPVKLRHASEAKGKRAEPVAALFEAGRARFAGSFPELENQLVALMPGGGYAEPGSPDRADAMVWALSELMLGRRSEPRIRAL